ncbi:MAG TPA: GNAT family N-acetyltransferase [Candidatus Limiplasma sp.]|nr:GNAT family N-acetyltransferase [Candidatus Limiplasma sp.]HRX07969.1 GNAT family N-acetyltransferase [Candidatus Limiplasma sp.]
MPYDIRPLTTQRVDDFFTFFDHVAFADHPEWGCDCYCCYYHAESKAEWDITTGAVNQVTARKMILSGRMRGLLAFDGDLPVGWCHYDLLKNLPGARLFYGDLASADDERALIACFTIAQKYRRRGIADQLLRTALSDLKAMGVKTVEAYPAVATGSDEHNYHGPLALYEKHGFVLIRKTGNNILVEKAL